MSAYFKSRWNESRGDEHDDWGSSWWYFETDSEHLITRQVEIYDSGAILKYDAVHSQDQFGMLGEGALDPVEFEPFRIDSAEFEATWQRSKPLNRPSDA